MSAALVSPWPGANRLLHCPSVPRGVTSCLVVAVLAVTSPAQGEPDVSQDQSVEMRLADLERQVQELKDRVWRHGISERLARDAASILDATELDLIHRDDTPGWLKLVELEYRLDGQVLARSRDSKGLPKKARQLWQGAIAPGRHTIDITAHYQGYGFGVFRYAHGYRFRVQRSMTIDAKPRTRLVLGGRTGTGSAFAESWKDLHVELDVQVTSPRSQ